jgi:hypothetical protein
MRQLWADIIKILTIRCEESSRLVSDSLDRPLRWSERLAMYAHVSICWSCARFRRQLLFIREASRQLEDAYSRSVTEPLQLTEVSKGRIKSVLAEAQKRAP